MQHCVRVPLQDQLQAIAAVMVAVVAAICNSFLLCRSVTTTLRRELLLLPVLLPLTMLVADLQLTARVKTRMYAAGE